MSSTAATEADRAASRPFREGMLSPDPPRLDRTPPAYPGSAEEAVQRWGVPEAVCAPRPARRAR